MAGLGTLADVPGNSLQPKLVDAVHLRWAFRPDLGFPWHGFYLFRREGNREERDECLSRRIGREHPGPLNTTAWASGIGTVESDRPLVLRDDFAPGGSPEFDLSGRNFLEFLPLGAAHRFSVSIGFRAPERQGSRCLRFEHRRPSKVRNPYQRLGFLVYSVSERREPSTLEIIRVEVGDRTVSCLSLHEHTQVEVEEPFEEAEVRLVSREPVEIVAFGTFGREVASTLVSDPSDELQVHRLTGNALTHFHVRAQHEVSLLEVCVEGSDLSTIEEIELTAFAGTMTAAHGVVTGRAGEVVSVELDADAMDRLRISGGNANLVELCYFDVESGSTRGWVPVDRIVQPIALPVRDLDYPASGNRPTDGAASLDDALDRISYGDPRVWIPDFPDLHEQCLNLVRGGSVVPMADATRAVTFPVQREPGDTAAPPKLLPQHPLQLLLLASMHAPIAEEVGLAWSDQTAMPGVSYDYLIVADYAGIGRGSVNNVLREIGSNGFTSLDGFIVFDKRVEPAQPLAPPTDCRAYALPGATRPDIASTLVDASCNAGLRWQLPIGSGGLLPLSPIQYHFWRTAYGDSAPTSEADDSSFDALNPNSPQIVVDSLLSLSGVQRPPDWPQFAMYGLDNAVSEGWYGYRLSNVDLFGRHSGLSSAARWFQWAPEPAPPPWYYQAPAGDRVVHPYAIGLLDKLPPPPPSGTEAFALDPADPFVQRDAVHDAWFNSLSAAERTSVIGLRVRWSWTTAHMRQAPDTKEFRVYFQGGRLNTLLGRTAAVTAASATETFVQTDIPNGAAADALAGCSLKQGPNTFSVLGNDAASPLRLRVRNIGPSKDVAPKGRAPCELTIGNDNALFHDYGRAHSWDQRWYVVGYNENVTTGTDDAGNPIRHYEVVLPAHGDGFRGGLPLAPDLIEPVTFGAVGVTACDGRVHTADDAKWSAGRWGGRVGNESEVSPPAAVFRVLRTPPAPPVPPPDSERVFATAADYHATSRYTFRWSPRPHLRTHVYRAMDETVFQVDWTHRPRPALAANGPIFPSEAIEARWDLLKRQQVAQELNALRAIPKTSAGRDQALALYRDLSNDALRVLAGLPGNEDAFAQLTTVALDSEDPANANRVGPDNPSTFVVDPSLRAYVDQLDGRSTNRYFYRACAVDGAQNRSALSLSGPPIWLPNVVPPRTPTFTKVLAGDAVAGASGDNKITLRWASNREADLAEYRIYRATDEAATRSLATLTRVHTTAVGAGDPMNRAAENVWTDSGVVALQWTYYCITAVDTAGNESPPSDPIKARAYDESLPVVPALTVDWEAAPANLSSASWTATVEARLERRAATELIWENASDWLPAGAHTVTDSVKDTFPWRYRLRARKTTGAIAVGPAVNLPRK